MIAAELALIPILPDGDERAKLTVLIDATAGLIRVGLRTPDGQVWLMGTDAAASLAAALNVADLKTRELSEYQLRGLRSVLR